ncbi:hypothetical protein [Sphingomonas crusticola]|uniref:hypothetical protein n=1 Tax=Sphingomonas crusticola TaxID=1697973 RepID=UPI000E25BF00|nr:hypothetical protein [Sphingomonas crusticola]
MVPRASLAAILFLVPFVALLGWLSTTSTVAVFTTLPSSESIASAEGQVAISADQARAAAAANVRAAPWFEGSRYRLHAARALLALPAPLRTRELPRVEQLTRASLRSAPMSAYGWTLLAFLRFQRGDIPGATRAWEMSVMVGRYVPNLMQSRLLLGMKIAPYDRSLTASVIDQVRVLAEGDPASLAQAARRGGVEAPVRAILAGSEQAAAFEQATKAWVAGAGARLKRQAEAKP